MRKRRGDILLVDLRGSEGHEKAGLRPCVVVQRDFWNRASAVTIVAPLTDGRDQPRIPKLVAIAARELGIPNAKDSVVDCGQLRAIDCDARIAQKLGELSPEIMARIDRGLAASLGLSLAKTNDVP